MEDLMKVLMQRLLEQGLDPVAIPAFVRNLSQVIGTNPNIGITELNRQLCVLGWDDMKLDNVTYQLGVAVFEPDFEEIQLPEGARGIYSLTVLELAG